MRDNNEAFAGAPDGMGARASRSLSRHRFTRPESG
jgi:hypothetical protein